MYDWAREEEKKWLQWIDDNKSLFEVPKGKEAVFFSGGILAEAEVKRLSEHQEVFTIGKTEGGQALEKSNLYSVFRENPEVATNIWAKASEVFAESAEGKVRALTQAAKNDSVFFKIELPTLFKEDKVTHINEVPLEKIKTIWDKDESEEKSQAKDEIRKELTNGIKQITWDNPPEEEEKKKQIESEQKKEGLLPEEKTKEEIEKEEAKAKKVVETVKDAAIDQAKTAVIGAVGGPVAVAAYEAKKALDEAKDVEKVEDAPKVSPTAQEQEAEHSHKVKVEYDGKPYTVRVQASDAKDAQEKAQALFNDQEFLQSIKDLKPGETVKVKAEELPPPPEPTKPLKAPEPIKVETPSTSVTAESPKL